MLFWLYIHPFSFSCIALMFWQVLPQWRYQKSEDNYNCTLYCIDFHRASQQMNVFITKCFYWISVIGWSFTSFDTKGLVRWLRACVYGYNISFQKHMLAYCLDAGTQIKKWQACRMYPQPTVKLALNQYTNTQLHLKEETISSANPQALTSLLSFLTDFAIHELIKKRNFLKPLHSRGALSWLY